MENNIEILNLNKHLRNEKEVADFEASLANLPESTEDDGSYLRKLFDVFVDDCDHLEVMWGLLHFVESFDDQVYSDALVASSSGLMEDASDWLEIILSRVLNNDPSKEQLVLILKARSETEGKAVVEMLNRLTSDEDPSLAESASEVLSKIR